MSKKMNANDLIAKLLKNLSLIAGENIAPNVKTMEITREDLNGREVLKVKITTDFGGEFVDYADPDSLEIL